MRAFDKFKNLFNPEEEEGSYDDGFSFDDEEDAYVEDYPTQSQPQQQSQPSQQQSAPSQSARPAGTSGVSINGSALELKVIRPDRWENVNVIADHLINRRTVVLNLENTNKETARRMIDFLMGVVYTIEGDIKIVSNNTWVITPSNVEMSQEAAPKNN